MTEHCFFTTNDNEWFQPTDHTRGPWHPEHCHAGPPTGIIARAVERLLPQQRLTRLTVNLTRPIPFNGFRVTASITKQGRIVSVSNASLIDEQDKVCVTATALHMTAQQHQSVPTHKKNIPDLTESTTGLFPIQQTLHNKPGV